MPSTAAKAFQKKHEHLAIKFNDPQTDSKTYWSTLKTFLSGIKIPVIPLVVRK